MASKIRLEQIEPFTTGDESAEIGQIFYFNIATTNISEDSAFMRTLTLVKDPVGTSSGASGVLGEGEHKHFVFATLPNNPGAETISKGTFRFYVTARKTSGTREATVKIKLYKQTSGGTQTLLVTSSSSPDLTGSYAAYVLTVAGGPFTLNSSDRLIAKVYYDVGATGTDVNLGFQWGNTDGERIEIPFYSGGLPTAETQTNNIYRPVNSPGGTSAFVGTIATLPGGANLTYNISSGIENAMVPQATTNLGKMRLHNTTRGNYALISNCNAGTNTVTLTANVPASWQTGDTITIASQTVSGGSVDWVDIEITSGPLGRSDMFLNFQAVSATAGDTIYVHPFETYAASKQFFTMVQVANRTMLNMLLVKIINNVVCIGWTGTPTALLVQEAGYLR